MSRYRVETTTVSSAPIDAVWGRLADASSWSEWGQWDETTLDREGVPAPDGVGAIRRLRRGRQTTVEEVVAFELPADGHAHFAYEQLSGIPVRDYHADVTLESIGGGTRIRWASTFDGAYPLVGALVQLVLGRFIPETARRLAAVAAEASP
jgi:hypothetical protein